MLCAVGLWQKEHREEWEVRVSEQKRYVAVTYRHIRKQAGPKRSTRETRAEFISKLQKFTWTPQSMNKAQTPNMATDQYTTNNNRTKTEVYTVYTQSTRCPEWD